MAFIYLVHLSYWLKYLLFSVDLLTLPLHTNRRLLNPGEKKKIFWVGKEQFPWSEMRLDRLKWETGDRVQALPGFRPAAFTNQVRSLDHFHLEHKLTSHIEELLFNGIKMYHFQENNSGIKFCTLPKSYCNTSCCYRGMRYFTINMLITCCFSCCYTLLLLLFQICYCSVFSKAPCEILQDVF